MKIQIKKSFIFLYIVFVLFFDYKQFLIFFLSVFIHELSHILIAKKYKLEIENLIISPLGIVCKINEIDFLPISKKLFIMSSGVLTNLFLFLICFTSKGNNFYIEYFKYCNLLLFIFNILPIYQLDGGSIYMYVVGYFIGILNASKHVLKLGKFFSFLIIIIGLIQVILFPFNIFIYIMGVYLFKKSLSRIYAQINFDFFKTLELKYTKSLTYKIKNYYTDSNSTLKDALQLINYDVYTIFYFKIDNYLFDLTEEQIYNYAKTFPITTKLCDIEKVYFNAILNNI